MIFFKRIFLFVFLLISTLSANAISMKVGDTEILDIGNISHLQGCQWTISRPNDVVFVTTPQSYSTRVTIKAVNSFSATSPCVVQCKYYYLELDPTTGRYTYSRTGYKDWNIFVGSKGDDSNGTGNSTIQLSYTSITIKVGEHKVVYANGNYTGKVSWSFDCGGKYATGTSTINNKIEVYGVCPGVSRLRATTSNGVQSTCKITILPKASYELGEIVEAPTIEGTTLDFKITNLSPKECALNWIGRSAKGDLTIPNEVHGFKVTGINSSAGFSTNIERLYIPGSVETVGTQSFCSCYSLKTVFIAEGVKNLGTYAFSDCSLLNDVTLPSTIKKIEIGCFRNSKITEINIPSGVKNINEYAFSGCEFKEIIIPEGVMNIANNAFRYCGDAKRLSLPRSLVSIGEAAFSHYANVWFDLVECNMLKPFEIADNTFTNSTYWNAKLYVPHGTKELYEETAGWKNFKNIFELEPTAITAIEKDKDKNELIYFTIEGARVNNPKKGDLYIIKKKDKYIKVIF